MHNCQISIIVPVYNAEHYLCNCVDSILNQSFKNFELILVDDGSKDNSSEICDKYSLEDVRVKVIHKNNSGAAAARKDGILVSKGNWIFFSDSDDSLPQNALEEMMQIVYKDDSYDIVCGTFINGPFIYKSKINGVLSSEDFICSLLKLETYIGPCAKLIKRSLFFQFNWNTSRDIVQNEDLLMLIGLSKNARKIYVDNKLICYNFISRQDSASSKIMQYESWELLFIEIERLINLENNKIKSALIIYKLNALYSYLILRGSYIDINKHQYLIDIINEWEGKMLSRKDLKIIAILKNIQLQRLYYNINLFKKKFIYPIFNFLGKIKLLIINK